MLLMLELRSSLGTVPDSLLVLMLRRAMTGPLVLSVW